MPPTSSRDFMKVAAQRLTTAEFLFENRYTLDAQYLAGYTVECSLKALIIEKTAASDRKTRLQKICSGASMHKPETLMAILRVLGIKLSRTLARRFRQFDWSTDLRYETGRRKTGETRGLLRTARETYIWVKGQL